MSPGLNRISVLQRFKRGNTVEIRNGIMFNFYRDYCIWLECKLMRQPYKQQLYSHIPRLSSCSLGTRLVGTHALTSEGVSWLCPSVPVCRPPWEVCSRSNPSCWRLHHTWSAVLRSLSNLAHMPSVGQRPCSGVQGCWGLLHAPASIPWSVREGAHEVGLRYKFYHKVCVHVQRRKTIKHKCFWQWWHSTVCT